MSGDRIVRLEQDLDCYRRQYTELLNKNTQLEAQVRFFLSELEKSKEFNEKVVKGLSKLVNTFVTEVKYRISHANLPEDAMLHLQKQIDELRPASFGTSEIKSPT